MGFIRLSMGLLYRHLTLLPTDACLCLKQCHVVIVAWTAEVLSCGVAPLRSNGSETHGDDSRPLLAATLCFCWRIAMVLTRWTVMTAELACSVWQFPFAELCLRALRQLESFSLRWSLRNNPLWLAETAELSNYTRLLTTRHKTSPRSPIALN